MGKKLQPKTLESIIAVLPAKEQAKLRTQDITPDWLREQIKLCKGLMKRDMWVGPIWFLGYSAALFLTGVGTTTITIFLFGIMYFIYTITKTGSFGINRKRVQVFEELLKAVE